MRARSFVLTAFGCAFPIALAAQQAPATPPDTTKAAAPATPAFNFSGFLTQIFSIARQGPAKAPNKFESSARLHVRGPAETERAFAHADVFQRPPRDDAFIAGGYPAK